LEALTKKGKYRPQKRSTIGHRIGFAVTDTEIRCFPQPLGLAVVNVIEQAGHFGQTGRFGRRQPFGSGKELIALMAPANDEWLKHSKFGDRIGERPNLTLFIPRQDVRYG
jgi:hypothetical protein